MKVRAVPIYFRGKKIAEIESAEYTHESGDEEATVTDGVVYTEGLGRTSLVCNTIVPVGGLTTDLKGALIRKEEVVMGVPVDGGFEQIKMRCMQRKYNVDVKTGKLTGSFTFNGGEPDVI
jgi:hypothetical protein